MNAVGYARVSTEEQGEDGAGMAAQVKAIREAVAMRGWTPLMTYTDVATGSNMDRPGLIEALTAVASPMRARAETVLVVSKLDRLSRSLLDFARLMEQAKKQGWAIVALDLGLDMTTPAGALVANVMAAVAEWERQVISERTRAALAVRKAAGIHCGRKPSIEPGVRFEIRNMASVGFTPTEIAMRFNERKVPTSRGGKVWRESTIRRVLEAS